MNPFAVICHKGREERVKGGEGVLKARLKVSWAACIINASDLAVNRFALGCYSYNGFFLPLQTYLFYSFVIYSFMSIDDNKICTIFIVYN